MPRVCTVCANPKRKAIDKALVAGEPNRRIAARFHVAESSLRRHRAEHLPAGLARAQDVAEVANADDLLDELRSLRARVNKLFDACDTWLTDPDDPTRYEIGPRASDVTVTYEVREPGASGKLRTVRRKAKLSTLLEQANEKRKNPLTFIMVETRHADPRKLVLDAANTLQGQIELIAQLLGELDKRPQINVLVASPEWLATRARLMHALAPYADARLAVAAALGETNGSGR